MVVEFGGEELVVCVVGVVCFDCVCDDVLVMVCCGFCCGEFVCFD